MKKFLLIILLFCSLEASASEVWNSKSGLEKLERSKFKNDFYQLINFYQPQFSPTHCSIATAVMILNSLNYGHIESQKTSEITKPNGEIVPFNLYSQESFFNSETEKIKPKAIILYQQPKEIKEIDGIEKKIYDPGLTLSEFSKILNKAYKMKVRQYNFKNLDEKNIVNLRNKIKTVLVDDKNYLVANFDGQTIGGRTHGHISAVAAYDQESDEVLILDSALHLNQWLWISLPELAKAMNTKDGENYRGFVIVGKS